MCDMRKEDWRLDDTLTEVEIREKMSQEGWQHVEAVGIHFAITSAPAVYTPPTSISPAAVELKQVPQRA